MKQVDYVLPEWQMVAGETRSRAIRIRADAESLCDLRSCRAELYVFDFAGEEGQPISQSSASFSASVDGDGYECVVGLASTDTEALCGKYIYLIKLTDASYHIRKLRGVLYISRGERVDEEIRDTVPQAIPSLTVDVDTGLITATSIQGKGYVKGGTRTTTGQLPTLPAQTFLPSTMDQVIPKFKYLIGEQTIKGDARLLSNNIKKGVSIFGVAGSLETGTDTTDADATASDLLAPKTAYVNGRKITGTIQPVLRAKPEISINPETGVITAQTRQDGGLVPGGTETARFIMDARSEAEILPGTSPTVIPKGFYLIGDQTVLGDTNLRGENIRYGTSIFGVEGSLVPLDGVPLRSADDVSINRAEFSVPYGYYPVRVRKSVAQADAAPPVLDLSGLSVNGRIRATVTQEEGYVYAAEQSVQEYLPLRRSLDVSDNAVTANPGYYPETVRATVGTAKEGEYFLPSVEDQVIRAGQFLTGDQTILGDSNLLPENIRYGVRLFGVDGSCVSLDMLLPRTESDVFVGGPNVYVPEGYYPEAVSKQVRVVELSTPEFRLLENGDIEMSIEQEEGYVYAQRTTSRLSDIGVPIWGALHVSENVVTAAAGFYPQTIRAEVGYPLYEYSYTPGVSDITLSRGCYLMGTQTIKGDTNLKAENIVQGVRIFGVDGTASPIGDVPQHTAEDIQISGANFRVPYGYYSQDAERSVLTADRGVPELTLERKSDTSAVVTARVEQEEGYVAHGVETAELTLDVVAQGVPVLDISPLDMNGTLNPNHDGTARFTATVQQQTGIVVGDEVSASTEIDLWRSLQVDGNKVVAYHGYYPRDVDVYVGATIRGTTYVPSNQDQRIEAGGYLVGDQIIKGDMFLVPGNIREGVEIFGVAGTFRPTVDPADASEVIQYARFKKAEIVEENDETYILLTFDDEEETTMRMNVDTVEIGGGGF